MYAYIYTGDDFLAYAMLGIDPGTLLFQVLDLLALPVQQTNNDLKVLFEVYARAGPLSLGPEEEFHLGAIRCSIYFRSNLLALLVQKYKY